MTDNKAEAVRAVQRLHRNLGHPTTLALAEMLESRGASEAILNVAGPIMTEKILCCDSCLEAFSGLLCSPRPTFKHQLLC